MRAYKYIVCCLSANYYLILKKGNMLEDIIIQSEELYVTTLIASMRHMAYIDGEYHETEKEYIRRIVMQYPEYSTQIEAILAKVDNAPNQEKVVLDLIKVCRDKLPKEKMWELIQHSAKVLAVDGRIDKEEEFLLKTYLLACRLPTSKVRELLDSTHI